MGDSDEDIQREILRELLERKKEECEQLKLKSNAAKGECPVDWDEVVCWPKSPAGIVFIQCPSYINGFDSESKAWRECTEESLWSTPPGKSVPFSNYTDCKMEDTYLEIYQTWVPIIKRITQVGYSLSLVTLIFAFFVLISIKKLRCPRNTLHMHLFVSFMLRAFIALLKDAIFLNGIGFPNSIVDGKPVEEKFKWECKLFMSIWNYFILANYSWILMEGLYLHNLIFLAPFSDSSAITLYVVLGWGVPFLIVGAWAGSRILFDDLYCWTLHSEKHLFLIIRIPIILSVVVNFLFFVNIVRVLFLKLQSSVSFDTRKYRYRKWAKSTLVLMPLFGVHYTAFLVLTGSKNHVVHTVWLLCDQIFGCTQGFFVAILYCFVNGEVRVELEKKWNGLKSESEHKNIWVPLNQISSKFYHRSTHEDLLTNGMSGSVDPSKPTCDKDHQISIIKEKTRDIDCSLNNEELTEEHAVTGLEMNELEQVIACQSGTSRPMNSLKKDVDDKRSLEKESKE